MLRKSTALLVHGDTRGRQFFSIFEVNAKAHFHDSGVHLSNLSQSVMITDIHKMNCEIGDLMDLGCKWMS